MPDNANDAHPVCVSRTFCPPSVFGVDLIFDLRFSRFWDADLYDRWFWWDRVADGWRAYSIVALKLAHTDDRREVWGLELFMGPLVLSVFLVGAE
ncbi:MAG TPA: hypothetical protein VJP78_13365 [Thermoleophilia bacterium]|nr:hypothetical protein [Thermoleophilia bacterium]